MKKLEQVKRNHKIYYLVKVQGFTRVEVAKIFDLTPQAVGLIVHKVDKDRKEGEYNL